MQIISAGPMVRTWNMRNEAKLNIFKQASRLGNFKNIAFSVANRHQRLLCYELSSKRILNSAILCGPCNQRRSTSLYFDLLHEQHQKWIFSSLIYSAPGLFSRLRNKYVYTRMPACACTRIPYLSTIIQLLLIFKSVIKTIQ